LRNSLIITDGQGAIAQLKTLPADEQDAIAARLLAEMEDEQTWKAQFESTSDDQWDRISNWKPQTNKLIGGCLSLFCQSGSKP
jgi:hypothetical protein